MGSGQYRGYPGEAAKVNNTPVDTRLQGQMPGLAGGLRTDGPRLLLRCLGPSGLPFSIHKFGNAEFSPARGVGALDRRVAGDVISHVLH